MSQRQICDIARQENTMTKTITGLFDAYADAEATVRELETAGINHDNISLIAHDAARGRIPPSDESDAAKAASASATAGSVVGGGAGLLAGLGMLAIPGIGPVVAAGWLVATAVGAVTGAAVGGAGGGIVGALISNDVPEDHANIYAEGVRRGGSLVVAKVDYDQITIANDILHRNRFVDAQARVQIYRDSGWNRFEENGDPLSKAELEGERRLDASGSI
jgi:hypothetical protein